MLDIPGAADTLRPPFDIVGFFKTRSDLDRADA